MTAIFKRQITTVKDLINALNEVDPDYDIRVCENFVAYGIDMIVPEAKTKILLIPHKKPKTAKPIGVKRIELKK